MTWTKGDILGKTADLGMRSAEREKAVELRLKEQLGYGEIAKRLGVPKSTLSYWLKDLPLSKQRVLELRQKAWSRGEASRELFRQTMRRKREDGEARIYREKTRLFRKVSDQTLFVAGLMLYLAEGEKKTRYTVSIANTDPFIIRFFVWWAQRFLKVPKKKMRAQLHLYENMNIAFERRFWLRQLGFRPPQLHKDQVRPLRPGSFSYSEGYRHGTCQLRMGGVKEKTELTLSIRAFLDTYNRPRA